MLNDIISLLDDSLGAKLHFILSQLHLRIRHCNECSMFQETTLFSYESLLSKPDFDTNSKCVEIIDCIVVRRRTKIPRSEGFGGPVIFIKA